MNKLIILGNLTNDPNIKEVSSGKKVCTFSVAINNKLDKSVTYIDIETWNKTADNCSRFLSKGRKVLIEGRIKLNTWTSKAGEKRSKIYCVADLVTFLDKSEETNEGETQSQTQQEDDEFADIPF